ncbi:hypothetical protein BKA67DRAFT_538945 [Truncatella angustata]|uniref:Methyltransferase type 11 domain-containing protein n=1 Tax=Truncatella angustata TaxID=152316 RepID=A0A9P8ZU90_9PEZI|nr:uncharacterized protein BKA67DRAFT_538945 [Truncatella angustata]KAH6648937.1 hypothetical protein BKA67DRAFT_538945 [Truncatella angustata]KAH8198599.1 hypothetical protein TruAng_007231 [Truncatella angustata]
MGGVMETSREEFPPSLTNISRREVDNNRPVPPQSRVQSRIPQNYSLKKPLTSASRPPLTHETKSWSSTIAIPGRPLPMGTTKDQERSAGAPKPRPVLRRKKSLATPEATGIQENYRISSGRTGSSSSIPRSQTSRDASISEMDRSFTDSPMEIQVTQKFELPKAITKSTTIYPELDRYRNIQIPRDEPSSDLLFRLATHDLPPPTPLFSGASSHSQLSTFSGSPSTRFSESPGGGAYSRDTTPTSMSSVSPGLIIPLRNSTARAKQVTPIETRPPVTRRRTGSISKEGGNFIAELQGLSAVTEALTSSSSSSTVREAAKKDKKKAVLPPNPPPRKSSQKLKKNIKDDVSPSKSSRKPARPIMTSPSPVRSPPMKSSGTQKLVTSPQARPTPPPSRPSREGTPDLYSQFGGPLPVIQSNLVSTNLSERRGSNQFAPTSLPRSTTPSSVQDRQIQSRLPVTREPTPTPKPTSTSLPQVNKTENGRSTRTPSPSISTFKSRFGIFSRRKTDSDAVVEKKDRSTRKGPAAGTGHEGYGKIGAVRRRSSSTANVTRGVPMPSSSSDSLASTQSTDPFFLARLNPVVIAGGEVIENRNTSTEISRTESNQSLLRTRPSIDSRNGSSVSLASREEARNTLWPSAIPRDSLRSRRPSDNSDSEAVIMKSTLAYRRSVQRLRTSPDQKPLSIPQPINTRSTSSPSLASVDTIFTDDSVAVSDFQPPQVEVATAPKKLTKRAKSPRKWNIFGRTQPKVAKREAEVPVAAPVKIATSKPVAFYTMMDASDPDDSEEKELGEILRDAEVLVPPGLLPPPIVRLDHQRQPSIGSQRSVDQTTLEIKATPTQTQTPSVMTEPPIAPHIEQLKPEKEHVPVSTAIGKPSRLPQVGRIPKVINTRPEGTSPKSFSRPFNRISLQLPALPIPAPVGCYSVAHGPSPPATSTPELSQDASTVTTGANSPPRAIKHRQSRSLDLGRPGKEFLAFSPRKGSECTTSSGSSSSGITSYAHHTAVVPPPTAPLAEDEVWDEYNDLLGDVPPSATSSKGIPFHLETYGSRLTRKVVAPLESPTVRTHPVKEQINNVRDSINTGKSTSSHFSADMTARINAAFRFDSDPPTTPFSVSEFVSGYGDRNNSVEPVMVPVSSQRNSTGSAKSRQTRASNSSSASEETPLSQVNIRVGSMTVSKWLTFGHVLFSPARDELIPVVGSLKRHSILVIDGLGNDDWSFYAAETYPAATFFNMSPRAPLSPEYRTSTQFPLSPPNHHQIQYTSHMDKFPFGAESFTTVVFRFPAAAPEAHFRNIIAEARRVLKPGGYMELAILDVDLNNMGSRARRGVRRLKERVSMQQPEINLSSTADLMLRLLGNQGFTDVKSCRVGVPVASAITNSSSEEGHNIKRMKDERSLAEMMSDETEKGDENITKMVAKVGRWWYNRLYEAPTDSKTSMWNDRALLAECEEWKTSLKLMVCHAKVPETRSRLASI